MTTKLARLSALHPWRVVLAWVLAIVLGASAAMVFLGDNLTAEGRVTNNPGSVVAQDLIDEHFPADTFATELAVVRSERYQVEADEFQGFLRDLAAEVVASNAVQAPPVEDLVSQLTVSEDRHAVLVPLRMEEPEDESAVTLLQIVDEADAHEDFAVGVTGLWTVNADFTELSEEDLQKGEIQLGLPMAMIILVLVFGALVAASLPLILAVVSIVVALGLTGLVAAQWELSVFVVNMLTAMGLALGIDYALFVVSRFREERSHGRDKLAAIVASGATASRAVLFSGSAFVLAMCGMLLVESTIMRSLAAGAILVALVSVGAALTLLPAVLSLLGDSVNRLKVPYLGSRAARARESRFWSWVVARVLSRPVPALAAACAFLVLLAVPFFSLNIGASGVTTLPEELTTRQGYELLERSFPETTAAPAEVVVQGDLDAPATTKGVAELTELVGADPAFGTPERVLSEDGEILLLRVPVAADAVSEEAVAAVRELRGDYVPQAFAAAPVEVAVGGATAMNIDYFDTMDKWLPYVLLFVLGLSFILLTVAFRSLVVPAFSILMNLLSVGAAYGLLVAVFQWGFGNELFGFQQVDSIEAWIPLFLFAVLFGLSMDYQVFLLSRIREHVSLGDSTRQAVSFGVATTGRIITGAALIIIVVFAGFAAGQLASFQQMGFALAAALLIDATVIRGVVVPAVMALLGRWSWYLPAWLGWIPHVEVEGHEDAPKDASDAPPAPQT